MRTRALSAVDFILALILAMGKSEFEGELEDALDALFRRHLKLLPEPRYLRYTPGRLTFEDELRSILFHLGAFSWTYEYEGCRGSYYTHYRIENLPLLRGIVEEARRQSPGMVAEFEALAPELERELEKSVEDRRKIVISGDPYDFP